MLLFLLVLTNLANLLRCAEQSAGGIDVLSTAGTDGGENTVGGEVITELLHLLVIHSVQRNVWNRMESDEIEAAVETFHQLDDGLGMLHTVVHTLEDDVLEGEATLVGEVVVAQEVYHLFDAHASFGWHQLGTLLWDWVVHGDGDMALAFLQESLQLVLDAHGTDGDALRTPSPTIVGGQDFRCTKHVVEVVHWLTLSHEHDVGQLVYLWQRIYLVQNVASWQTSLEPLLARLTEEAVHLAAHL